jgi:hypothetical protein
MNSSYEEEEPQEDPYCVGCHRLIEEGSVVQFGDGIWHFEWYVHAFSDFLPIDFGIDQLNYHAPLASDVQNVILKWNAIPTYYYSLTEALFAKTALTTAMSVTKPFVMKPS